MTHFPVQNGHAIIPQGTTIINDRAFFGCQDLTNVIIPEGVTTIGESAFRECSQLNHVYRFRLPCESYLRHPAKYYKVYRWMRIC